MAERCLDSTLCFHTSVVRQLFSLAQLQWNNDRLVKKLVIAHDLL
jgi:hypothetical protein